MTSTVTEPAVLETAGDQRETDAVDSDEVLAELLVEEISIDGMCGVY